VDDPIINKMVVMKKIPQIINPIRKRDQLKAYEDYLSLNTNLFA